MDQAVALTAVIFLVTYGLIATERVDKTIAALLGGTAVVVVGIIDQEEAFGAIDLNVIFLLAGMMIARGDPATHRASSSGWPSARRRSPEANRIDCSS